MMIRQKIVKPLDDEPSKFQKFLVLFVIGFFMIFVGILLIVIAVIFGDSSVNFGALIFIGPFPIVVGTGPEAPWMVLFAIILTVLSIVMFLILRREMKGQKLRLLLAWLFLFTVKCIKEY